MPSTTKKLDGTQTPKELLLNAREAGWKDDWDHFCNLDTTHKGKLPQLSALGRRLALTDVLRDSADAGSQAGDSDDSDEDGGFVPMRELGYSFAYDASAGTYVLHDPSDNIKYLGGPTDPVVLETSKRTGEALIRFISTNNIVAHPNPADGNRVFFF